jgi:hypothetical protein
MSEEDLKEVLAKYQQKSFELFNQNIVLETQVNSLQKNILLLENEIEKLKKVKKLTKAENDF